MAPKRAIITGITGQDGAYLAKLLLSKDYVVMELTGAPPLSISGASRNLVSETTQITLSSMISMIWDQAFAY